MPDATLVDAVIPPPGEDGHHGDQDDETAALVAGYSEDGLVQAIAGHGDDDLAARIAASGDPTLLVMGSDDEVAREVASYEEEQGGGGDALAVITSRPTARLRGMRLLTALAARCCAALQY